MGGHKSIVLTKKNPQQVIPDDPFMVIVGDSFSGVENLLHSFKFPSGSFDVSGMLWSFSPPVEVASLGRRARDLCGQELAWEEVVSLANYSIYRLKSAEQRYADALNKQIPTISCSRENVYKYIGVADLLAWDLMWEFSKMEGQSTLERPVRPADGLRPHAILAAYALLMVDHCIFEWQMGQQEDALNILGIAGKILSYASMDKEQSRATEYAYLERHKLFVDAKKREQESFKKGKEEAKEEVKQEQKITSKRNIDARWNNPEWRAYREYILDLARSLEPTSSYSKAATKVRDLIDRPNPDGNIPEFRTIEGYLKKGGYKPTKAQKK